MTRNNLRRLRRDFIGQPLIYSIYGYHTRDRERKTLHARDSIKLWDGCTLHGIVKNTITLENVGFNGEERALQVTIIVKSITHPDHPRRIKKAADYDNRD